MATAASIRGPSARGPSRCSGSWKARRYSSLVAGEMPRPSQCRHAAATASPTTGRTAPTHGGPVSIASSPRNTTRSNRPTSNPTIAPSPAASTTTSFERCANAVSCSRWRCIDCVARRAADHVQPSFHASSGSSSAASANVANASATRRCVGPSSASRMRADLALASLRDRVDERATARADAQRHLAAALVRLRAGDEPLRNEAVAESRQRRRFDLQFPGERPRFISPRPLSRTSARYCGSVRSDSTLASDRAATPTSAVKPTAPVPLRRPQLGSWRASHSAFTLIVCINEV